MSKSAKTKESYGIALCRRGEKGFEIMLICKRYTYAYTTFVCSEKKIDHNDLVHLFNNMTVDEKMDILSLKFEQIWFRIWNNAPKLKSYNQCKKNFELNYTLDNGKMLNNIINNSVNNGRIWEIPKGRKSNRTESDVNCAVREFYEETGIKKTDYILSDKHVCDSYIDDNILYKTTYWLAIEKPHNHIKPKLSFKNPEQKSEVCDVRWMNVRIIQGLSDNIVRVSKQLFKIFKSL